ncbi:MAG: hypothetical protein AAGG47_21875 [Pseudomonadota bacterium]
MIDDTYRRRRIESRCLNEGAPSGGWRIAVERIALHPDWRPSDTEQRFVADMRRLTQWRAPSERQARWLLDIAEKLSAAKCPPRPSGLIDKEDSDV